jgi:hypothetical protein
MSVTTVQPASRPRLLLNLTLTAVLLLVAAYAYLLPHPTASHASTVVPDSPALESRTGVRFSRVAVVGDQGLVTLFYVVLDPERATAFQADREHPPRLASESRDGGTRRASIMRAGHAMRAGQTYYLVYQNTDGAIRSGERVSITYGGLTLRHVPVL